MERQLNLDIPESVAEFETLIRKVLPKNIMFQIIYGKGLEFDGYRYFLPIDDASNIDWKASVRSGKILIRKYIEERDFKIIFLVDVSENMVFGSTNKLKCEYAAELVSALAHVILGAGDRVGFFLFNNEIIKKRDPGFGNRQFSILAQELSDPINYGGAWDLNKALEEVLGRLGKDTTMVFIVSDFIRLNDSNKMNLKGLASLFETIALIIRDPLDISFPDINKEIVLENPESRDRIVVNPHVIKYAYQIQAIEQLNKTKNIFRDANIDFAEFKTNVPFSLDLANFLKERSQRRVYKKNDVH
ncbi:MAG: DUF58 domain-containing protein [Candidatus Pacearchaeota archaeon]